MQVVETFSPDSKFELRFASLAINGRAYSFPCDAAGKVCIDDLGDRARESYLFARACVGFELLCPRVLRVGNPPAKG